MLSESTIQELKQILEGETGQELTLKEASEIANALVGYYDILAKIYQRENENDTRRNGQQNI